MACQSKAFAFSPRGFMADLDAQSLTTVNRIVAGLADQPGALLPILHGIQKELGYIPAPAVTHIAAGLNLSRAEVHGVISFYHYFRQHPPGQHVIQFCRAEACQAVQCEETEAHAKKCLGIDYHGTSADRKFTLEAAYCLGNCAAGPSVMIDDKLYGRVTPERFDELIREWGAKS
jgi:formate dehydrogenase subunit gamma